MNKSLKFVSLLGGLACLAISVSAQSSPNPAITDTPSPSAERGTATPQPSDPQQSDQIITNANSAIDAANTRFTTIDKDSDGRISRSEFTLSSPQPQAGDAVVNDAGKTEKKRWWKKDTKDATTADELSTGSGANSVELFNQLDTDKNGFLTQAELAVQPKITN